MHSCLVELNSLSTPTQRVAFYNGPYKSALGYQRFLGCMTRARSLCMSRKRFEVLQWTVPGMCAELALGLCLNRSPSAAATCSWCSPAARR